MRVLQDLEFEQVSGGFGEDLSLGTDFAAGIERVTVTGQKMTPGDKTAYDALMKELDRLRTLTMIAAASGSYTAAFFGQQSIDKLESDINDQFKGRTVVSGVVAYEFN